jgi:hypothetical protein
MKEMNKALVIAKKSVTSITYERELLGIISHQCILINIDLFVICAMLSKMLRGYI